MLHNPPRITHREGTLSRENTMLSKTNGDALRHSHGDRSNDIEMQRRNSGADSTSSGDMLLPAVTVPVNHTSNEQQAPAPKLPAQSTLANVTHLPTIESSEDNSSQGSVESSERGTTQTTAQSSICTANRLTPVEQPNNMDTTSGHQSPPPTNQNNNSFSATQGNLNAQRRSSMGIASKTILEKEEKENGHVPKETEDTGVS